MQARRIGNLLSSVVKPMIETVGIILVFLYLLYAAENAASLSSLLPKLLLFVTIMVRSMPLINSINSRQNIIAYYEPFLMQMEYNSAMEESLCRREEGGECLCRPLPRADNRIEDNTIEMKDVVYRYPKTQKVILNHINLTIPSGSCVGIVGPSGSGKSTLVDILLGLLQPETGNVFWKQTELSLVYSEFLERTAYIPQMVMMLDDTIRRNIAFGVEDEKIDEEQLLRTVEEAQLQTFIDEQPNGLDTVIGERGIRISGGQRQRIGIARALYRNPQILIFDEATSALDHDTEKAIIQAIQSLRVGRTIVMIAHRLNTLEGCEVIYRVENGHVEAVHQ
jgi:ABC-type multidrug transport system fused ATPase/permease subunit